MSDSSTTIQQLKDSVEQFKCDRKWGQYHTPTAACGGGITNDQKTITK